MIALATFVQQQLQQLFAQCLVPHVVAYAIAIIAYVVQGAVPSHANAAQNVLVVHVDVADFVLLILVFAVQYAIWLHANAAVYAVHSLADAVLYATAILVHVVLKYLLAILLLQLYVDLFVGLPVSPLAYLHVECLVVPLAIHPVNHYADHHVLLHVG